MSLDQLRMGRIAVLFGGNSAEREVSLNSGRTVVEALQSLGLDVIGVDPSSPDWASQLGGVTLAFIILHGPGGEDGSMQGALQTLGIPYTGSGVLGSALAMDKTRSKELWQGIGLATAGFVTLHKDTDWQGVIDRFGKVFVKPACEGSSIGMSSADSASALRAAFELASQYAGEVLAEQFIAGPEYTVAILGDWRQTTSSTTTRQSIFPTIRATTARAASVRRRRRRWPRCRCALSVRWVVPYGVAWI